MSFSHSITNMDQPTNIKLLDRKLAIMKKTGDYIEIQATLDFVSKEFAQHAEKAFDSKGFQSLNFEK